MSVDGRRGPRYGGGEATAFKSDVTTPLLPELGAKTAQESAFTLSLRAGANGTGSA